MTIPQLAAHAHALVPEIGVEQPVGSNIADAFGSIDFGFVSADGGNVEKTFMIRNIGAMDLMLGSITKDGTNASDFTVGAPGATTLVPGASTTFTVTFNPATSGAHTAMIHIASNDADENPFDITLIGRRLTHQEEWRLLYFNKITNGGAGADANDFEGDGLSNLLEFATGSHPKQFNPMPGVLELVGNVLEFTYQRSKDAIADGFIFSVEFRGELAIGDWSSTGVTEEITSQDDDFEQVKASFTLSDTQDKGFMRLNMTAPP